MSEINKEQLRSFDGWISASLFRTSELNTSLQIEDELWLMLKSVYYIETEAKKIIMERRKINAEQAALLVPRFRSFCRQAENYYFSAKKLPWNSSPLLYYYSFLNLAKAVLLLKRDIPNKVHHGLSFNVDEISERLDQQNILILPQADGVFPMLYRSLRGDQAQIESARLPISKLLGFLEDITFQVNNIAKENVNFLNCRFKYFFENTKGWILLLVPDHKILHKDNPFSEHFCKNFSLVEDNVENRRGLYNRLREPFACDAHSFRYQRIYQSRELDKEELLGGKTNLILDVFQQAVQCKLHSKQGDFILNLPFKIEGMDNWLFIDEFLSLYLVMFFLSTVVRYRPDFLDNIQHSSQRYIYESFVASCPSKFLRHVVNLITGKNYIIVS